MPTDLSTLDLATINAAQGLLVTAIRNQVCQWEQDAADAVSDGRLMNALMLEHWAFAAELLASKVGSELTGLFIQVADARCPFLTSTPDQVLDALALEVVSAQAEPDLVAA